MTDRVEPRRVLIVGGGSGIARQLVAELSADGAEVVLGSRHPERTEEALGHDQRDRIRSVAVDLSQEATIEAAAAFGPFDFVISFASAHANGPVTELDRDAIAAAFDAKVLGPLLLVKHLSNAIRPGGGFIFLSGVAAWKPAPGLSVMATTNGAVAFLVEALAVEIAPIRAIAVSPGIIDSGAWDSMGEHDKSTMFAEAAAANPVGRIGSIADVVSTIRYAMDNTFVTGTTLHVDGGGRLA